MEEKLASRIREIMEEAGGEFSVSDICDVMGLAPDERKPVRDAMLDMKQSGHVEVVERGLYRLLPPKTPGRQKKDVMWSILRIRKTVTKKDLEELCDVSAAYASEWLNRMIRQKYAKRVGNTLPARYQIINDPGPNGLPGGNEKAERRKKIRRLKKEMERTTDELVCLAAEARHLTRQLPD